MMPKILLTGASGFVGKYCLEYLSSKKLHVHCMSRTRNSSPYSNISWHVCNLLQVDETARLIKEIAPDYLIHCAWYVEHQQFWNSPLNIDYIGATVELWKLFLKYNGKKAIFLGSCAEVMESKNDLKSVTLYGKSKQITSELISLISQANPSTTSFIWGRIFGLFGPGENKSRIVPYLLNAYMNDQIPELKKPHATYDFIYVKNLAKMIVELLFSDVSGVIDFGENNQYSIEELAKYLNENYFANTQSAISLQNFDKQSFIPDLSWQKRDFFQFETMSFDESIREYLDFLGK